MILSPGFDLTLRPMKYPHLYQHYKDAIKNNWTVEEPNFTIDRQHLTHEISEAEHHMIKRLVAFFATGDSIVSNNLVINLYRHVNSPEARLYYSRQLFEESVHVDFYLRLLEEYVQDEAERAEAFAAIENIPSIKAKADFALRWIDHIQEMDIIRNDDDKRKFLLVLICFAAVIEGLFFMGAFSYVYFLRSRGLLPGLAEGTNWVFRDETCHMNFAMDVVDVVRREQPELFTPELEAQVRQMLAEGIACELQFADDALQYGVLGFTRTNMEKFLKFCADQRLIRLGYQSQYNEDNPFDFMVLQDVMPLTNFFEKKVAEYQVGITGSVSLDEDF